MHYTVSMKAPTMQPANPSEIEFADEGSWIAYGYLVKSTPGSKEEHAAAHAYVDWLTVKFLGVHSLSCTERCPYRISTPSV